MEKGALHEMLGGIRFQITVAITYFSPVNYCCVLWSTFCFPYVKYLVECNISLYLKTYKFNRHYHCFCLIMNRK